MRVPMELPVSIRREAAADEVAIAGVTMAAFRSLAISQHNEQVILASLRAAGALTLSLQAEWEGQVEVPPI